MRYILIEKDDVGGVLYIVRHNNCCQKKIKKEKKQEMIYIKKID
jgi:hypothetical protein